MPNTPSGVREHKGFTTVVTIGVRRYKYPCVVGMYIHYSFKLHLQIGKMKFARLPSTEVKRSFLGPYGGVFGMTPPTNFHIC